jgi:hypothetical protein
MKCAPWMKQLVGAVSAEVEAAGKHARARII